MSSYDFQPPGIQDWPRDRIIYQVTKQELFAIYHDLSSYLEDSDRQSLEEKLQNINAVSQGVEAVVTNANYVLRFLRQNARTKGHLPQILSRLGILKKETCLVYGGRTDNVIHLDRSVAEMKTVLRRIYSLPSNTAMQGLVDTGVVMEDWRLVNEYIAVNRYFELNWRN